MTLSARKVPAATIPMSSILPSPVARSIKPIPKFFRLFSDPDCEISSALHSTFFFITEGAKGCEASLRHALEWSQYSSQPALQQLQIAQCALSLALQEERAQGRTQSDYSDNISIVTAPKCGKPNPNPFVSVFLDAITMRNSGHTGAAEWQELADAIPTLEGSWNRSRVLGLLSESQELDYPTREYCARLANAEKALNLIQLGIYDTAKGIETRKSTPYAPLSICACAIKLFSNAPDHRRSRFYSADKTVNSASALITAAGGSPGTLFSKLI